jgi:hypothetical protein
MTKGEQISTALKIGSTYPFFGGGGEFEAFERQLEPAVASGVIATPKEQAGARLRATELAPLPV